MTIEELESRIRYACEICAGEVIIWCSKIEQSEVLFNISGNRDNWYGEKSCYRFINHGCICSDKIGFYYNYKYNIIKYEDLINGDYYVTKRGLISMLEREEEIKSASSYYYSDDDETVYDDDEYDDDDTEENNEDWEDWEIN